MRDQPDQQQSGDQDERRPVLGGGRPGLGRIEPGRQQRTQGARTAQQPGGA
jgi:hypothetical protein